MIDLKRIFHGADELCTRCLRNAPRIFQPGLKFVFLSVVRTVSREIRSTTSNSTSLSASNCSVHCSCPSGAALHANCTNRAFAGAIQYAWSFPFRSRVGEGGFDAGCDTPLPNSFDRALVPPLMPWQSRRRTSPHPLALHRPSAGCEPVLSVAPTLFPCSPAHPVPCAHPLSIAPDIVSLASFLSLCLSPMESVPQFTCPANPVCYTTSTTTAIHESEDFPAKMRVQKRILNNHGPA